MSGSVPWPGVASAAGTYDRIVSEVQRSWPQWAALHGFEPFAVDRAIEHAVHLTIATLQRDPCIAPDSGSVTRHVTPEPPYLSGPTEWDPS